MARFSRIIGTGGYLPERVLTNAELELSIDTTDAWITERTGIRQRHIAADGEFTVDLAEAASRRALEVSEHGVFAAKSSGHARRPGV